MTYSLKKIILRYNSMNVLLYTVPSKTVETLYILYVLSFDENKITCVFVNWKAISLRASSVCDISNKIVGWSDYVVHIIEQY